MVSLSDLLAFMPDLPKVALFGILATSILTTLKPVHGGFGGYCDELEGDSEEFDLREANNPANTRLDGWERESCEEFGYLFITQELQEELEEQLQVVVSRPDVLKTEEHLNARYEIPPQGSCFIFPRYVNRFAEANDPAAAATNALKYDCRQDNPNFLAYSVDIIVDPCRGLEPDCCSERFGAPEYMRQEITAPLGVVWFLGGVYPGERQDSNEFPPAGYWPSCDSEVAEARQDERLRNILEGLPQNGRSRYPYVCTKPCVGDLEPKNASIETVNWCFDLLDSDENFVWAANLLDGVGKIYKRPLDGTVERDAEGNRMYEQSWYSIDQTGVVDFTASAKGSIFKITPDGEIKQCNKPCSGKFKVPTEVEGHPMGPRVKDPMGRDMAECADRGYDWFQNACYVPVEAKAFPKGEKVRDRSELPAEEWMPPRHEYGFKSMDKFPPNTPPEMVPETRMTQIDGDQTHLYVVFNDGALFTRRLMLDPVERSTWLDHRHRDVEWGDGKSAWKNIAYFNGPTGISFVRDVGRFCENSINGCPRNETNVPVLYRTYAESNGKSPEADRDDNMFVEHMSVSSANDYIWAAGKRERAMGKISREDLENIGATMYSEELLHEVWRCRKPCRVVDRSWERVYEGDEPWSRWEIVPYPIESRPNDVVKLRHSAPENAARIVQIEADQLYVWAVTSDARTWKRTHLASPATVPWTLVTDPFTETMEEDFSSSKRVSRMTASANPDMPVHLKDGVEFQPYTVERYGGECEYMMHSVEGGEKMSRFESQEEECKNNADRNCMWNRQTMKCEKRFSEFNSRQLDSEVSFDSPECSFVHDFKTSGELTSRETIGSTGYETLRDPRDGSVLQNQLNDDCRSAGVRRIPGFRQPACWDYNETVDATARCYHDRGKHLDTSLSPPRRFDTNCVSVGYTSTAFIVQCGSGYVDTPNCGTFVELHIAGNETAIAAVRLPTDDLFTSGYRTTAVPLSFTSGGGSGRIACHGPHELWWVQRTGTTKVVEMVKPFFITTPICDWNDEAADYEMHHYEFYATT